MSVAGRQRERRQPRLERHPAAQPRATPATPCTPRPRSSTCASRSRGRRRASSASTTRGYNQHGDPGHRVAAHHPRLEARPRPGQRHLPGHRHRAEATMDFTPTEEQQAHPQPPSATSARTSPTPTGARLDANRRYPDRVRQGPDRGGLARRADPGASTAAPASASPRRRSSSRRSTTPAARRRPPTPRCTSWARCCDTAATSRSSATCRASPPASCGCRPSASPSPTPAPRRRASRPSRARTATAT